MSHHDNKFDKGTIPEPQELREEDLFFLQQAEARDKDPEEINKKTAQFLSGTRSQGEDGLVSLLLTNHLGEFLNDEQINSLRQIIDQTRFTTRQMQDYYLVKRTFDKEIDRYLTSPDAESSAYWELGKTKFPIANALLQLDFRKAAAKVKISQMGNSGFVVEEYVNPKTQRPGIWMSFEGVPLPADLQRRLKK